MPSHLLTNFELQKYYQNEPKYNGVYARNNSVRTKDEAYVINLDEFKSIGTHWIVLFVNNNNNNNNITYFDSFVVKYIPRKIKKLIGNKNIITNIYRIQTYDSIMCGYFCIGFIDFMLKCKSLLEYTNLFSSKEYKNNDKLILKHFQ